MSTALARRLDRVEIDRFTEAVREFRPWFLAHIQDADVDHRDRAGLVAIGGPADGTPAEIHAWIAANLPRTPGDTAICGLTDLLMERPDDHAAIRAALAVVAPYVGRCAADPPLTILSALQAGFVAG
jgi:hypothetical protein